MRDRMCTSKGEGLESRDPYSNSNNEENPPKLQRATSIREGGVSFRNFSRVFFPLPSLPRKLFFACVHKQMRAQAFFCLNGQLFVSQDRGSKANLYIFKIHASNQLCLFQKTRHHLARLHAARKRGCAASL